LLRLRGALQLIVWTLCILASVCGVRSASATEYRGIVMAGGLPLPGATVTVTQGAKKSVTVTDLQGLYSFPSLADGTATVEVDMTGFATSRQETTIAPSAAAAIWDLKLLTLEEIRSTLKPSPSAGMSEAQTRVEPRRTANSPLLQGNQDVGAAPAQAIERASDGLLINGSVNNAATSQYTLGPRFGNTASGKPLYTFSVNASLDNSAFDARSYSLSGFNTPKPETNQFLGGFALQGPLKIPGILRNGPNTFIG
jgi:hypothetical protein